MHQMYADLLAAIARLAVHDLHTGYSHPRHMDARTWLDLAGLLEQAQHTPRRKQRRNVLKGGTTMATLNYDEQRRVHQYEELEARRRDGGYVNDHELETAKQIADNMYRNAELREQHLASLKAVEDAKTAANQQRIDQHAQTAADAYLRVARSRYPGTDADWEKDKDEILRQWRIRNALGDVGDAERLQAEMSRAGMYGPY